MVGFANVSASTDLPAPVTRLIVRARVGDVTLEGTDDDEVRVEAAVRLRSDLVDRAPAGAFADHVVVAIQGEALVVADAHIDDADERCWGVTLAVHAPRRLAAAVATALGDVAVTRMDGALELASGLGDLAVAGRRLGPVSCETGCGDIAFDAAASGALSLSTGCGHIACRAQTVGITYANTGCGDVCLTLGSITGALSVASGVGEAAVAIAAPPTHSVTVDVGTGSISLCIPQGAPGAYALQVGAGDITIAGHEGLSVARHLVSADAAGVVGSGSPTYTLTSGVGHIALSTPAA